MLNLLNEARDSKFVTRKWKLQWNAIYYVGNEIIYNAEVLKSNHCNYNDTYILVKGDIVTTANYIPTQVAFKNCTPFTKCITKKRNNNTWCWRFRFSHINAQPNRM